MSACTSHILKQKKRAAPRIETTQLLPKGRGLQPDYTQPKHIGLSDPFFDFYQYTRS